MIKSYQKKTLNPDTGRYAKKTFYEVHKMIDGKRYHKRGFLSKSEAIAYELYIENSSTTEVNNFLTLDELFHLWIESLKHNGTKKGTIKRYTSVYEMQIKEDFKGIAIEDITIQIIRNWQDDLLKRKSRKGSLFKNKSLDNFQTILIALLNFGYKNGYIDKTVIINRKLRKNEIKEEMDFYTPNEFNLFISAIDDNVLYNAFFNVLYFCGLRKGEAMALKWNDINYETRSLRINKSWDTRSHEITTPKTNNSYRTILIPNRAWDSLMNLKNFYQAKQTDDYFIFGYYKPISVNTVANVNIRYAAKAGLKKIRVHDFRHSHVSLLINQGFSPFEIAKRLGHTPEMVNNTYGHWFRESEERMIDFLNSV